MIFALNSKMLQNVLERCETKSDRVLLYLKLITFFLTFEGLIGFTMFICEESMQASMFASFAYNNAKDYDGLTFHLKTMKQVHSTSCGMISYIGWLNPLMFPAYKNYCKSDAAYIKATERTLDKYLSE